LACFCWVQKRVAEEEAAAAAALDLEYSTVSDRIGRFWKRKGEKVERGKDNSMQQHKQQRSTRRTTTPTPTTNNY
jgi:hypothetical protein